MKKGMVKGVFSGVAHNYDVMNDLMSAGKGNAQLYCAAVVAVASAAAANVVAVAAVVVVVICVVVAVVVFSLLFKHANICAMNSSVRHDQTITT